MVSGFAVFSLYYQLYGPFSPVISFSLSTFVPYMFQYSRMSPQEQDWPFRLEMWDDHDSHVEELIALVSDHAVARAAFAEAVSRRPGKSIILRQKSRVLADSRSL